MGLLQVVHVKVTTVSNLNGSSPRTASSIVVTDFTPHCAVLHCWVFLTEPDWILGGTVTQGGTFGCHLVTTLPSKAIPAFLYLVVAFISFNAVAHRTVGFIESLVVLAFRGFIIINIITCNGKEFQNCEFCS